MRATGDWVVIAAFNESEVVGGVIAAVCACYPRVVVVDDGSADATGDAALAAGALVLRHSVNLGQGAALETGIRFALAAGAERIVTFDADGQHRVDDIDALLARQRETGADVVIGSRFLGGAEGLPRGRRLLLKLAAAFTRRTSGVAVTDPHNGLRVFTRRAAEQIRIRQNRMAHASEIIDRVGELELSLAEAPVTIIYTEYSLQKGQRLGNALNILAGLFLARLNK
jgi:polyprenyl-phospho-N-acetylgalactosaminyl synthase